MIFEIVLKSCSIHYFLKALTLTLNSSRNKQVSNQEAQVLNLCLYHHKHTTMSLFKSRGKTDLTRYFFLCRLLSSLTTAVGLSQWQQFGPSWNVWPCLEAFWVITTGWILLASSGQRPEMLLNILQCTENATAKNHTAQNVSTAKVEKPCSSTTSDIPATF